MKLILSAISGVVVLSSFSVAYAQEATVLPPATPAIVAAPAVEAPAGQTVAYLRAGTSVPVRTLEEMTTKGKKLKVGQRFNIEVSEPVRLHGKVVSRPVAVALVK